ncbi:hypothetical protein [Emticicia agri]|uniref:Uncharacterized protein n=1 Tax=Emticicia agri TaxID=2492393 RepID=A0A4Q5LZL8_9BACT|nr:hypothetical protein [Emticicia agri]RYU95155.1 hypothetical protein EWM59_12960 [Emticicia agri]
MKKLLLLFATLLISLNSMALSFPHNSYGQKRILNQAGNKSVALTEVQAIKTSLTTIETKCEESATEQSFVEMFASYIISLFTEKLFQNKSIAFESFEKAKFECFAIKQDFDCQVIG